LKGVPSDQIVKVSPPLDTAIVVQVWWRGRLSGVRYRRCRPKTRKRSLKSRMQVHDGIKGRKI